MKKKISYKAGRKTIERTYEYIPIRFILAMLITILEVVAIIGIVILACWYLPYFYLLAVATQVGCVVSMISSDENPDHKIPWIIVVLVLPVVGFMLYLIFHSRKFKKKYVKRLTHMNDMSHQKDDSLEKEELNAEDVVAYRQVNLISKTSDSRLFKNTALKYFASGEEAMPCMLDDLRKAEKFIYIEYFIIEQGRFWNSILEILEEKAKNGVDVKVVFDDIGCMRTLPGNYAKSLRKKGIDATPFSRLKGQADSEFNNRNHRKIMVIDGYIGYTGGINLADEYINEVVRFGYWKDSALRLEGEAVWELTRLFLLDYGVNVKEEPTINYQLYPQYKENAKGYVLPFGDGPKPLYNYSVGANAIKNMLASAKNYAYFTTPYLIIDNDMCTDIESAALRGVDVRIVLPHVPDKKFVFYMSRSYYHRLMNAGVKIYEYTPGFIHAKTYIVDDEYALLGTINLDYRSLVHHFENGVWIYKCDCIEDVKKDVLDVIDKSELVTESTLKSGPIRRFLRAVVRMFAPLL